MKLYVLACLEVFLILGAFFLILRSGSAQNPVGIATSSDSSLGKNKIIQLKLQHHGKSRTFNKRFTAIRF